MTLHLQCKNYRWPKSLDGRLVRRMLVETAQPGHLKGKEKIPGFQIKNVCRRMQSLAMVP